MSMCIRACMSVLHMYIRARHGCIMCIIHAHIFLYVCMCMYVYMPVCTYYVHVYVLYTIMFMCIYVCV